MIDQRRGRQGECVALAERMALQQLQVSLLAPLPLRDGFKRVDVPADELGERGCTVLNTRERGRILQDNLAVFCPTECGGSMRERAALTVEDRPAAAYADDRRKARISVGLLANFDRRHDGTRGDMAFLSPLCLPGNL
jgi:hypothetical protein